MKKAFDFSWLKFIWVIRCWGAGFYDPSQATCSPVPALPTLGESPAHLLRVAIFHTEQLCKDFLLEPSVQSSLSRLALGQGLWGWVWMTQCLLKCQLPKLKDLSPKSIACLLVILSQPYGCPGQPLKLTSSEFLLDSAKKYVLFLKVWFYPHSESCQKSNLTYTLEKRVSFQNPPLIYMWWCLNRGSKGTKLWMTSGKWMLAAFWGHKRAVCFLPSDSPPCTVPGTHRWLQTIPSRAQTELEFRSRRVTCYPLPGGPLLPFFHDPG